MKKSSYLFLVYNLSDEFWEKKLIPILKSYIVTMAHLVLNVMRWKKKCSVRLILKLITSRLPTELPDSSHSLSLVTVTLWALHASLLIAVYDKSQNLLTELKYPSIAFILSFHSFISKFHSDNKSLRRPFMAVMVWISITQLYRCILHLKFEIKPPKEILLLGRVICLLHNLQTLQSSLWRWEHKSIRKGRGNIWQGYETCERGRCCFFQISPSNITAVYVH